MVRLIKKSEYNRAFSFDETVISNGSWNGLELFYRGVTLETAEGISHISIRKQYIRARRIRISSVLHIFNVEIFCKAFPYFYISYYFGS